MWRLLTLDNYFVVATAGMYALCTMCILMLAFYAL